MSVTLPLKWLMNACVSNVPNHFSDATLIVEDSGASVLTFPYSAENICVKSIEFTTNLREPVCIFLNHSTRDFISKCSKIFEMITLEILNHTLVFSLQSDIQALKYQLPVINSTNRIVIQSSEDEELILIGDGLLKSWVLFDKKVTISASPGQKSIKIEAEQPKLCTLLACDSAPKSACSFKCSATSMNILQLLSPDMVISIVFMKSGLLLVKNDSEQIYIAPQDK